jgi:hypothetical protein
MYSALRRLSRIETPGEAVERDFGTWWHTLRAADSVARARVNTSLRYAPDWLTTTDEENAPQFNSATVIPVDVIAASVVWWKKLSDETRALWTERLGGDHTLAERLEYALARHREEYAEDIEAERPLAVEMGWGRDLPGIDGAPSPARLVGYVDEVYLDTRRNVVALRDHKAAKALATQTTADDMMDSQLQLYAWGASPEVTSWGVGPIRAVGYDRMRMTHPKPPELTLSGRLRQREGQPSINGSDSHTYLEWCTPGVEFPGYQKTPPGTYYPEPHIVERLMSPTHRSIWFQRTLSPLNVNLVKAHLRAAIDGAADMLLSEQRAARDAMVARNLSSSNCRWCDFVKLCRAEMYGGPDADYDLADMGLYVRP